MDSFHFNSTCYIYGFGAHVDLLISAKHSFILFIKINHK